MVLGTCSLGEILEGQRGDATPQRIHDPASVAYIQAVGTYSLREILEGAALGDINIHTSDIYGSGDVYVYK